MASTLRKRPVPHEETEGGEADPLEPTTLRPPTFTADEAGSSNYAMLRDSCRATEAAEPADDELAIEAEIVRVALDRESQRIKK
jgi:hypothetical protein